MPRHDDDRFRPKVAPPRSRGDIHTRRFTAQVIKTTKKTGAKAFKSSTAKQRRPGARLGRGVIAAKLAGRGLGPLARRVIIKARLVVLKHARPGSTATHLRYIQRDSAALPGEEGMLYGPDSDAVSATDFEARGRNDRHQFRFTVSAEDGSQLEDLKTFTRQLMSQMEHDLGTRLDWVAADHWNTEHPHTHIVLRGKDDAGHDLIIAREYISHGMRNRASELATEWLGLRTEREIQEALNREVDQERWTSLDRLVQSDLQNGLLDLRTVPKNSDARRTHARLVGRIEHLEKLGLATPSVPGVWSVSPSFEQTLRAMGERGDIVRTLQRAISAQREYVIADPTGPTVAITGRIVSKGLADELSDRAYLILDATDGRAHYIPLASAIDINDLPTGAIVTARGPDQTRAADRTIARIATDGTYRTSKHLEAASLAARANQDPSAFVETHVRRLEVLRRVGIVDRIEEGVWRIPPDFLERARSYDARRADGALVDIRSHLPIDQQERAIGATWLDRQLLAGRADLASTGFGAATRDALTRREHFLIEQGFAERRGQRVILTRNLLATLRDRELDHAARSIANETGLTYRPLIDSQRVAGVYRRSITLATGRFAILDDSTSFTLVPWRQVIEQRLGQSIAAVVRGEYVSWELGRHRALTR